MREKITAVGNRVSPGAMNRLRTARSHGWSRRARAVTHLQEDVAELRDLVKELQAEVDETRRDNIRLVELTDIVENRLAGRTSD
ncbi:DUF6752 domain-containing protein [Aeromicrobium sp. CF4.19]|uniref:DUF6752 domain-containing protein n=1 Tax=Aeromicrobium sp. CF4.19 TaxID=3373082 RepID=UPI003EE71FE4